MRPARRPARAALGALPALLLAGLLGCSGNSSGGRGDAPPATPPAGPAVAAGEATPAELAGGERLFDANCAGCHGARGAGTRQGPPLVHIIYEPNHHGDEAFALAAARGVRAHHWSFGDMPPVPTVDADDVRQIVAYIRWLQREAGIGG
jgi:cytochrome c